MSIDKSTIYFGNGKHFCGKSPKLPDYFIQVVRYTNYANNIMIFVTKIRITKLDIYIFLIYVQCFVLCFRRSICADTY